MQNYDKIYSQSNISGEIKPSQILGLIWKNFTKDGNVLDLGCGQGSDLLFLAQNNFKVVGVDNSEVAIKQIVDKATELNLDNVKAEKADVREYIIEKDFFDVISCQNVLNFVSKEEAMKVIESIKGTIKTGGYILIQVFTTEDPSISTENKFSSYFEPQELLHMFDGFRLYYYLENTILDQGHPGFESPHKHGVARIIVKK
jgi:tellurite methyltransferase